MMADWAWTLASSVPTIAIVAALLLVALAVGYAPFGSYLPVIGPYVKVARLVAFLAFGVLGALVSANLADGRAEIAQLKRDLSFAETQLENLTATAADKARLAAASSQAATVAQLKADTYATYLASRPVASGCDLDGDDVKRLRDIAPRRAVKSKRTIVPRLRGFGRLAGDAGAEAGQR